MLPHHHHHSNSVPSSSTSASDSQRSSGNHHSPSPSSSTQQACAACKYQRRKCVPNCILAPYFPHDKHRQFLNAHKLFGVSNITKIIKNLGPFEKDAAMRTIIFQSDARAHDPVLGCYGIVHDLQRQINLCQAELDLVLRHLDFYRQQEVAAALGCYDIIGSGQVQPDPFQLGFQEPAAIMHQQGDVHFNNGGTFADVAAAWAMQDTATSATASNSAIMASAASTCSSPPPPNNFQQQQQMDGVDGHFMNRPSCFMDDIKPLLGLDLSCEDNEGDQGQFKFGTEENDDKRRDQPSLELDPYNVSRIEEHHRANEEDHDDDQNDEHRRHEELLHDDLKDAATLFTLTNCTT